MFHGRILDVLAEDLSLKSGTGTSESGPCTLTAISSTYSHDLCSKRLLFLYISNEIGDK